MSGLRMMHDLTSWTSRCVLPACLALLLGCASAPKTSAGKTELHIKQAVALLVKSTDADSLAVAALLSLESKSDRAWPLIQKAVAKAPDRAELVWLQIEICRNTNHCDSAPLESRLQSLDGGNGFGWTGSLARATASKDDAARLAALEAIGKSKRFNIYWTSLNARLSLAAVKTKALTFLEASRIIAAGLASQVLPAYGQLTASCRGEQLNDAELLSACRGIASALEQGDTYLTEMIGVQIAQTVWPEESPQWQAAAQDRRIYEYTSARWAKVTGGLAEATMAERYLLLCAQYQREQDIWRAQLIDAGENPDPPAE